MKSLWALGAHRLAAGPLLPRVRSVVLRPASGVEEQGSGCATTKQLKCEAPVCPPADPKHLQSLAQMFVDSKSHGGVLVVTGAGVSTASGIPDYRSPGRPVYKPMTHQMFVGNDFSRRRYWARSMIGFKKLAAAAPNEGHFVIARLAQAGYIRHIITQNVDRLHQRAGAEKVLELHGTTFEAECLECGAREDRSPLQGRLEGCNPSWTPLLQRHDLVERPDGDVDLPRGLDYSDFEIPPCLHCGGGPLKPAVVFHGGSLTAATRDEATRLAQEADSLLVLGSTLSVFSSFRIAKEMNKRERPISIVNHGETRADPLVKPNLRFSSHTSDVMAAVARMLLQ